MESDVRHREPLKPRPPDTTKGCPFCGTFLRPDGETIPPGWRCINGHAFATTQDVLDARAARLSEPSE